MMFVAAVGLSLLFGAVLSGCSSDDETGNNPNNTQSNGGTGGTSSATGAGGAGGYSDAGVDGDADVDGGDPWDLPGLNGNFYTCKYNSEGDCSIIDLDVDEHQMHLMSGFPINRKGKFDINQQDPLASVNADFGFGVQNFIGHHIEGLGYIHPAQVTKLSNDYFLVPFSEDATFMSGISLIDQNGAAPRWLLSPTQGVDPINIQSGLDKNNRIYLAVTDRQTDNGSVISYGIKFNGEIDEADVSAPIPTTGQKPSAIAKLSNGNLAVLNTKGASGATIDIINTEATAPIQSTIQLGQNTEAVPLYEIAMTADKKYGVVAGGEEDELKTIYVVDMETAQVKGSLNLEDVTRVQEIRDIDVKDMKAYISTVGGPKDGDEVFIIDFSDPTSPAPDNLIAVGRDLGSIAVHVSGTVYVVATDRYGETPGTAAERWTHIVAVDTSLANSNL